MKQTIDNEQQARVRRCTVQTDERSAEEADVGGQVLPWPVQSANFDMEISEWIHRDPADQHVARWKSTRECFTP